MPEYISAVEASKRYPVSERTIRKWLEKGVLTRRVERVRGIPTYAIDTDELELVLSRRNIPEHPVEPYPIDERLLALELRVASLERAIIALERPTIADVSTPVRTQQERPGIDNRCD